MTYQENIHNTDGIHDSQEIAIIIVLYCPSKEDIRQLGVLAKSYRCVLVDNTPLEQQDSNIPHLIDCVYISMNGNKGIAAAHNKGFCAILADKSCKYCIILDQDSRVSCDYPKKIVQQYLEIKKNITNLAFLGPTVVNKNDNVEYHSIIHKDTVLDNGFVERRDIISSGCCFDVDTLKSVGLEDEGLFIDFVDCEWCWRAQHMGFVAGITKRVKMQHRVGVKDIYINGYHIMVSAPFRYFYQYRNHLWLCHRHYVPTQWKINQGIKHMLRFIYFPFLIENGGKCWKYMCKGIIKGLQKQPKEGI